MTDLRTHLKVARGAVDWATRTPGVRGLAVIVVDAASGLGGYLVVEAKLEGGAVVRERFAEEFGRLTPQREVTAVVNRSLDFAAKEASRKLADKSVSWTKVVRRKKA